MGAVDPRSLQELFFLSVASNMQEPGRVGCCDTILTDINDDDFAPCHCQFVCNFRTHSPIATNNDMARQCCYLAFQLSSPEKFSKPTFNDDAPKHADNAGKRDQPNADYNNCPNAPVARQVAHFVKSNSGKTKDRHVNRVKPGIFLFNKPIA